MTTSSGWSRKRQTVRCRRRSMNKKARTGKSPRWRNARQSVRACCLSDRTRHWQMCASLTRSTRDTGAHTAPDLRQSQPDGRDRNCLRRWHAACPIYRLSPGRGKRRSGHRKADEAASGRCSRSAVSQTLLDAFHRLLLSVIGNPYFRYQEYVLAPDAAFLPSTSHAFLVPVCLSGVNHPVTHTQGITYTPFTFFRGNLINPVIHHCSE